MMKEFKIPFFLAWKYLRHSNKWTLLLIIFFMSIAFINMIFITSLFNGIVEGFNTQIINTNTGHIFITPPTGQDTIADSANDINTILSVPRVIAASAQMIVPGTLAHNGNKGTWSIYAINPDQEKKVTNVADKMIAGNYLDANDENSIILGSQITDSGTADSEANPFSLHGVQVGDTVVMTFGSVNYQFLVKGIFNTKFINTDDRAYITQTALTRMNPQYSAEATSITVRLDKRGNENDVIQTLKIKGLNDNIYSWREASSLMSSISDSFLSINVILSIVGILIAAITVFIVIYIDISTRRQEIGILRAIGIKPYLLRTTYVILSAVYSVAGVILGTGLFFAIIVPYFKVHPFVLPIADATLSVNAGDFIARLEVLIWVAIAAGLIPSILITRIKILDAIWGSK